MDKEKQEKRCQFPVCEYAIGGPFQCTEKGTEKRGEWLFCSGHSKEYDKDQSPQVDPSPGLIEQVREQIAGKLKHLRPCVSKDAACSSHQFWGGDCELPEDTNKCPYMLKEVDQIFSLLRQRVEVMEITTYIYQLRDDSNYKNGAEAMKQAVLKLFEEATNDRDR